MTKDEAVSDLVQRYLCAVGEELPRNLRADVTRELRTLVEDKLEDRARILGKPVDVPLAAYVLQEIGEPGEVARRYDPSPQYLVGPRFYPAFVKIGKIGLAGLAILVLLTTVLGHAFTPEGARSLLTWGTLGRVLARYFQMAITLFGEAVIVLAILERTKLGQKIAPSGRWDPLELPEAPEAEEDRVTVVGAAVDVCLMILFAVVLNFFPQWVGVIMVNKAGPTFVRLTDMGVYLPILAINVWLALALVLKLTVLRQLRWTTPTRWADVGLGLLGAAILLEVAARSTLQAPASAPAFQPVLWVFSRLLYVVPFAVLIGPLLRIVRLVKGHPAPAAAR
jgi:hypothetical protein